MHGYNFLDLNWYLQFVITAFAVSFGLLYIVKNTASKYFVVDDQDDTHSGSPFHPPSTSDTSASASSSSRSSTSSMPGLIATSDACFVCGNLTKKYCARCKLVRYCSESCQRSHWFSGHKRKCQDFQSSCKSNLQGRRTTVVALVPATGVSNKSKKILFPYEDFVELFNWKKPGFRPCGLLNCGNSCFANVVLQCLAHTRPLVAYLLEKDHQRGCRRNDWCFMCELQTHVERVSQSFHAFSPINILSRLPKIGGNLGHGKQEDAHEFMRFAIDTMQSVCLDEYGGERAVHPSSQETTLIQHIFGGLLQSQVTCTKCNNVSRQFENMMDLTVEIQGDAASLEECLEQFTAKEWLDGDNMYKCDGCNDYVLAWKRLTIHLAPNVLTIALKRFQSGRFGKLNKRVTFPEILNLGPYMSEAGDGNDTYSLYAVVVHVDMLNASFFGHYVCYMKDFSGNWYRIDDCKVTDVELDEVLSQGAYMLLYSRVSARRSYLNPIKESSMREGHETLNATQGKSPSPSQPAESLLAAEAVDAIGISNSLLHDNTLHLNGLAAHKFSTVVVDGDMPDSRDCSVLGDVGECGSSFAVAHDRVTSAVEDASTLSSCKNSSAARSTKQSVVECAELSLPVSDVENGNETGGSDDVKSMPVANRMSHGLSTEIHVSKNCKIPLGVSASTSSIVEEAYEIKGKPEKCESTMLPSSGMGDASGKLEKTSCSGSRLKPLILPGFLGKQLQKNLMHDEKDEGDLASSVSTLRCGNSSAANCFAEASEPKHTVPALLMSNVENGNGTDGSSAVCMPITGLRNNSCAIQSHVCENGDVDMGVSAPTSSTGEEADEMNSVNPGCKPRKAESTVSGMEDVSWSLEKTRSPGARSKPLFPPGFLAKQP